MTSMTEHIDVAVDQATAFKAFTEEIDQWWGNGPIDAYESWRLVERRIEPGVGGRLLDDYGDEQLVTGTITIWEPPARLAWQAHAFCKGPTPDDVHIDVTFEPRGSDATRITVTGTVPAGVDGTASLAMVRMAPQWFPRHVVRRTRADAAVPRYGRLHLGIRAESPSRTARFLAEAFQLEPTGDLPDVDGDPDHTWIELRIGTSFVAVWGGGGTPGTDTTIVFVDDLDAHRAHAEAHGAVDVSPITEHGYRAYTARDCDGRQWQFAQSGPRIGR